LTAGQPVQRVHDVFPFSSVCRKFIVNQQLSEVSVHECELPALLFSVEKSCDWTNWWLVFEEKTRQQTISQTTWTPSWKCPKAQKMQKMLWGRE